MNASPLDRKNLTLNYYQNHDRLHLYFGKSSLNSVNKTLKLKL